MSSTTMPYVYIPNLVGRQMLRIPTLTLDNEPDLSQPTEVPEATPSLTLNTTEVKTAAMGHSRKSSVSVSVESVDEEE
ncbi:hypothetical protein CC80DRAFT_496503 [Byssothecium circinans]|uniref:Uncharacterized protein n=1 Tax=Byssothecium circinans TaxID=147558 RepID=A0A6A5TIY6_9PLEO|nr:hypothetical protein CC80DRAFT_496503 [Byssothecium circinans]